MPSMTVPSIPDAKPVIVRSFAEALAAAETAAALDRPLMLQGEAAAGVGWLAALLGLLAERHPGLVLMGALDCAEDAGTAQGALRRGIRHIRFTGPEAARRRLAEIAAPRGAVVTADALIALDLMACRDLRAACRDWLTA
jgi:hypothetical protein